MQMVLEGRPSKDLDQVLNFCLSLGLPVCLEDLGVYGPSSDDIRNVAEATTAVDETIHSTWFPVTPKWLSRRYGPQTLWVASEKADYVAYGMPTSNYPGRRVTHLWDEPVMYYCL